MSEDKDSLKDKELKTDPDISGGAGESGTKPTEAPLNLPEKFNGKSAEEIAKSYIELEKKLGDQSNTIEEGKKFQAQMDTVLQAIWADPDLYRKVENGVKKFTSGETIPETRKVEEPKKGDEEPKGAEVNPQISDLRVAQENQILKDFQSKYGYSNLSDKERKDSFTRLALALAELVDPSGSKPIKKILSEIPLAKLPRYLENAHFIANKEQVVAQAKRSALLSQQENEAGSIGSFAASSGKTEPSVTLTSREREVAQKMGISEEAYAKRKGQIQSEASRFES